MALPVQKPAEISKPPIPQAAIPQAAIPQAAIAQAAIDPRHPVARLAELHAEAEETARLANLLGRSIHLAIALPALAAATLAAGRIGWPETVAWSLFTIGAAIAVVIAYRRAIGQPFERTVLKTFSQDLSAILVFAGFAWGAGAFLALPADANIALVVLFAAVPGTAVAVLLRERESVFLFLAPVAALASFACVLRPLAGGALDAAFVLIACIAVAASAVFADARKERANEVPALPDLA